MEPMLHVADVAKRLDISADQVYRLLVAGRIRSYRVGLGRGHYRISPQQLADYLKSCETTERVSYPAKRMPHLRPRVDRPDGLPNRWIK